MATGEGVPPPELLKVKFCERMGWTFEEFDRADARMVYAALAIWQLEDELNGRT